ncbi:GtrA family protein [Blastomonas fulva]|uniref:GtrA family protein n=1 Tax=Blastomonas fulva TaxID=1550728 RepID=UPI003D280438
MAWLRELLSFGAVGIAATLTHVLIAWVMIRAGTDPYIGNLLGATGAFGVSFLGNARLTFRTNRSWTSSARRYALVSLFSLVVSSLILALVERLGLALWVYLLLVVLVVPPVTFLLAKLWAFAAVSHAR